MVPETTVGENYAAIVIEDKIRPPRQVCILHAKIEFKRCQAGGKTLLNGRIAGGDSAHIFTACGFIMDIRHRPSPLGLVKTEALQNLFIHVLVFAFEFCTQLRHKVHHKIGIMFGKLPSFFRLHGGR